MMLCSMVFLGGCAPKPTINAPDVGCIWTQRIDVTEFQVEAMKKEPGTWRPLALQIKDFNDNRARRCS